MTESVGLPDWIKSAQTEALQRLRPEQVTRLQDLCAEGRTAAEIAKVIGTSVDDARLARMELGIPPWTNATGGLLGNNEPAVESPEFIAWKTAYLQRKAANRAAPLRKERP